MMANDDPHMETDEEHPETQSQEATATTDDEMMDARTVDATDAEMEEEFLFEDDDHDTDSDTEMDSDATNIEEIEMLEALLYLQARPVSRKEIAEVLQLNQDEVVELVNILRERYYRRDAPYVIKEEEDSYHLQLKDEIVRQLKGVVVRKAIPRPALRILAYITFYEYVREEIVLQSHLVRSFGKGVIERLDYLQRLGFIQLIPHGRSIEVRTTKQLFNLLGVDEENKDAMKNYIQKGLKKYILKMATA